MYDDITGQFYFQSDPATQFPIEANRLGMTWVVLNNDSQEQCMTLKNNWNEKAIKVLLSIKNDDFGAFSFSEITLQSNSEDEDDDCKSRNAMEITIGPSCQKDVFVSFQPRDELSQCKAQLVIKPHGVPKYVLIF